MRALKSCLVTSYVSMEWVFILETSLPQSLGNVVAALVHKHSSQSPAHMYMGGGIEVVDGVVIHPVWPWSVCLSWEKKFGMLARVISSVCGPWWPGSRINFEWIVYLLKLLACMGFTLRLILESIYQNTFKKQSCKQPSGSMGRRANCSLHSRSLFFHRLYNYQMW